MKLYALLLFIVISQNLIGQNQNTANAFSYSHCLVNVSFSGFVNSNYVPITKDDGSSEFLAPQFINDCQSGTIKSDPVAYVSSTKAKVEARFTTNCPNSHYVRGLGPTIASGQIMFPSQQVDPENGEVIYPMKRADRRFTKNVVKYFEKFEINWQISYDNINWTSVDKSENSLYVTHNVPILGEAYLSDPVTGVPIEEYIVRHSSIHFSCKHANGLSDETMIVDAIHSYFAGLSATDIAGDKLTYWGAGAGPTGSFCVSLGSFFTINDGTCGTWSWYMKEMLNIHRISGLVKGIYPDPDKLSKLEIKSYRQQFATHFNTSIGNISVSSRLLFMVKEWDINTLYHSVGNINNWQSAMGLLGAPAQNNEDPVSIFGDHAFIAAKNSFYDPSYGLKINSGKLMDYEDEAIHAVSAILFVLQVDSNLPPVFYLYAKQINQMSIPELKIITQ